MQRNCRFSATLNSYNKEFNFIKSLPFFPDVGGAVYIVPARSGFLEAYKYFDVLK